MLTDRTQRVKDAHAEASGEIEALKRAREEELGAFESKVRARARVCVLTQFAGAEASVQKEIDADVKSQLADIEHAFSSKHDKLVQLLVERVGNVEPKAHHNLKKVST